MSIRQALQSGKDSFNFNPEASLAYWTWAKNRILAHQPLPSVQKKTDDLEDQRLLGIIYQHLGLYHQRKRWDWPSARASFEQAIPLLEAANDSATLAMVFNSLANIYGNLGDLTTSLDYYKKGLQLLGQQQSKEELAITYDDLGHLYMQMGNLSMAERYGQYALQIAETLQATDHASLALIHLSNIRIAQKETIVADSMLKRAIQYGHELKDPLLLSLAFRSFGDLFYTTEAYEDALKAYQTALDHATSISYKKGAALCQLGISKTLFVLQDIEKALLHGRASLDLAQDIGHVMIIQETAGWMSSLHESLGHDDAALAYYKLGVEMKDSVDNLSNRQSLLRQQIQQEFLLHQVKQEAEISKQTQFKNLYLAIGVLLLLLVLGLIHRLIFTSRTHRLIQEAMAAVEASEIKKNAIYTNITHEFRTPLTLILGAAEELHHTADQRIRNWAGLVQRQGSSLLALVNQLLDLAQLASGKWTEELVQADILYTLRSAIESIRSLAEEKGLELTSSLPAGGFIMDYHPEKMQQVLMNIFSNAIKYSHPGGSIRIEAVIEPSDSQSERFSVIIKDTGIGIDAKDLPQIFDRFFRGERAKTEQGAGIGLAVTREILQISGGDIQVQSIANEGTTVSFWLPVTRRAPLNPTQAIHLRLDPVNMSAASLNGHSKPLPHAKENQPVVLIVEDNPEIQEFLQQSLNSRYQVLMARNGKEGLNMAIGKVPDLIICDVLMPVLDGLNVCKSLKEDARTSHIPIIFLTAKASLQDKIEGLKSGADDYLYKPFHQEELLARTENLLLQRKKLHEFYRSSFSPDGKNKRKDIADPEAQFLTRFRTLIEDDLEYSDLNMDDVSKIMAMSRMQLHRKIKALTGLSATIYIRSIRLMHAKDLLEKGTYQVGEVAYKVGFNNPKYFSKVFREEFGQTPSEFAAQPG